MNEKELEVMKKEWTDKLIKRMLVRILEIRNRKPFLVRDGLDEFIRELETLV